MGYEKMFDSYLLIKYSEELMKIFRDNLYGLTCEYKELHRYNVYSNKYLLYYYSFYPIHLDRSS